MKKFWPLTHILLGCTISLIAFAIHLFWVGSTMSGMVDHFVYLRMFSGLLWPIGGGLWGWRRAATYPIWWLDEEVAKSVVKAADVTLAFIDLYLLFVVDLSIAGFC